MKIYTVHEAAEYTGRSPDTIRKACQRGILGHSYFGMQLAFTKRNLDAYLRRERSPRGTSKRSLPKGRVRLWLIVSLSFDWQTGGGRSPKPITPQESAIARNAQKFPYMAEEFASGRMWFAQPGPDGTIEYGPRLPRCKPQRNRIELALVPGTSRNDVGDPRQTIGGDR